MGGQVCRDRIESVNAFVDGQASAAEMVEVEAHLASCANCRSYAQALRALKRRVQAAAKGFAIPVPLSQQLEKALARQMATEGAAHPFRVLRQRIVWSAVSALLIVVMVIALGKRASVKAVPLSPQQLEMVCLQHFEQEFESPFPDSIDFDARPVRLLSSGYALVSDGICTCLGKPLVVFIFQKGNQKLAAVQFCPKDFKMKPARAKQMIGNQRTYMVCPAPTTCILLWKETNLRLALVGDAKPQKMVQLADALRLD